MDLVRSEDQWFRVEFELTKILWLLIKPLNLIVFLLIIGWLIARWRPKFGRWVITFTITIVAIVVIVPIGQWLLLPLENRFPPPKIVQAPTGIIVLGGALDPSISADRKMVSLNSAAERMTVFIQLAKQYPNAKLVFSGGSGDPWNQSLKEAPLARRFFASMGLNIERIIFESNSRNTYENALFSYRLVKPKADKIWILITSARHMPRAIGSFRRVGWPVTAYPVDYRTVQSVAWFDLVGVGRRFSLLNAAWKEWVGLAFYYLKDRIPRFFPQP
jgi:uncharacterized SAM-binding protein YcdF (DUF218 family)